MFFCKHRSSGCLLSVASAQLKVFRSGANCLVFMLVVGGGRQKRKQASHNASQISRDSPPQTLQKQQRPPGSLLSSEPKHVRCCCTFCTSRCLQALLVTRYLASDACDKLTTPRSSSFKSQIWQDGRARATLVWSQCNGAGPGLNMTM